MFNLRSLLAICLLAVSHVVPTFSIFLFLKLCPGFLPSTLPIFILYSTGPTGHLHAIHMIS